MLQALEDFLIQKGFNRISFGAGRILARKEMDEIAVIRIYGSNEMGLMDAGRMEEERRGIEAAFVQQGIFLPCRFLSMIVIADEVSEYLKNLAEQVEGVWYLSEQAKRVYVFERQSTKYWNLYEDVTDFLADASWKRQQKQQMVSFVKMLQPVTLVLVIINILIFAVTCILGDVYDAESMYQFGAVTWEAIFADHEFWRLFTCMFLHFGIAHLASNMVSLLFLGSMLEKRLGHVRYGILYMVSGLAAGLTSTGLEYYKSIHTILDSMSVSAGASGAVFGVIGGLVCVVLFQKHFRTGHNTFQEIPLRSLLWMTFFTLFAGFTTAGVDNAAHVGGLIFGFLLSYVLAIKA